MVRQANVDKYRYFLIFKIHIHMFEIHFEIFEIQNEIIISEIQNKF